jgi:tricorn protease
VARGRYGSLACGKGMVFYTRESTDGWHLYRYHLKDKKEELVLSSVANFVLNADASKALVNTRNSWFVIDAKVGAKAEKAINTSGLLTEINPRNEWRQIIQDVYRINRDYFYDPGLHGVDWEAVRDRALAQVDLAAVREDLTYIIAEMVSELNAGHTYVFGGNVDNPGDNNTGWLGCSFEQASDSQGQAGGRISSIYRPGPWELEHRSPLSMPGNAVSEGEFLLAIKGISLRADRSPYELLQGSAGKTVKLTVGPNASRDGKERDVLVTASGVDNELRLRAWIECNRRWVDEQSGGRVGYIYVRSTGGPGLTDLVRQFNGQFMKDALIIDERWNGGGMIPDRFIELLDRPIRSYWARRHGNSWRTPHRSHAGPKVMIINGHAGSGGDAFPYYFRQAGLGKLVGTRTWGGLIGISGNPGLIDGSGITVPTFGIFESDGTWAIEGYGVDPDYEVINDPASLAAGRDLQLEKALEVVTAELELRPYSPPARPTGPDRRGHGIPVEER